MPAYLPREATVGRVSRRQHDIPKTLAGAVQRRVGALLDNVSPIRIIVRVGVGVVFLGLIGLWFYLPHVMRSSALDTALQSNLDLIDQVKLVRSYYADSVLKRAVAGGSIKPSSDYRNHPNQIPLPATLVKDISELMEKNETRLTLVSPYPWPHRKDRKMSAFEQKAWQAFQQDPERVISAEETREGQRILRVAVADRMTSEACTGCHNADPNSIKRDWALGDVRAVFQVSRVVEPMLRRAEERSRNILVIVTLSGLFGCAMLIGFMALVERHSADRAKADEHAHYLAGHDLLTGLGNRARLQQALDAAFTPEFDGSTPALILIDLDKFKPINDTFGHATGDRILALAAGRMRALCGEADLVARLGGDEFAVLVADGRDADKVQKLANSLCGALSTPFEIDDHNLGIGASAGVAFARGNATNSTDLMLAADLALYAAKAAGRGQAHIYRPAMMLEALKRRRLEAELRDALRKGEIELHYQPIVNARTGELKRMEALMRWNHPELGSISPVEFIPLAEETGQIVALGAWALHKACADIERLGGSVGVAVNISPVQIRHESLLGTIREALTQSGLAPERLEVEITEGVLLENSQQTLGVLHAIRNLGVGISLDDFGTGYSCLSYLQHYPITCIKVDRSFVSALAQQKGARAIISTVVSLARNLGMVVVAEGVETDAQLRELAELGCDEVQGYHLGRPGPLATLAPATQNPVVICA